MSFFVSIFLYVCFLYVFLNAVLDCFISGCMKLVGLSLEKTLLDQRPKPQPVYFASTSESVPKSVDSGSKQQIQV